MNNWEYALIATGAIYGAVALLVLAFAVLELQVDEHVVGEPSLRWAARAVFLFWAWPVLLLPSIVRGVRRVWGLADWGKR